MGEEEKEVVFNSIRTHYKVWSGVSGPIICVHGLTANCRYFDHLGEKLAPNYKVIAYDLRGRGNSSKPVSGYNLVQHASDLENFLTALDINSAIFVGHSLGAAIVAFFAAHFPDKAQRLILVDGGGGGPQADYESVAKSIQPFIDRLKVKYTSVNDYLEKVKLTIGEGGLTRYMYNVYSYDAKVNDDGTVSSKVSPAAAFEDFMKLRDVDMASALTRIKCPALFLRAPDGVAGNPPLMPRMAAELISGAIPDCSLQDIPGTNHATILLGESDATFDAIKEFLNSS